MGRDDFQRKPDRIYRMGWDLRVVQRFGRDFFQCQASLLVFLPKLLVKESSIFVPKFRAVSRFSAFFFFNFSKCQGGETRPLLSLVPGW